MTGWVAEQQTIVGRSSADASERLRAFNRSFAALQTLVEDTYESAPLGAAARSTRGKTVAVINIHHRDQHHHSEAEISAITLLGQQLSSAIAKNLLEDENARLADRYRLEEQRRAILEEKIEPNERPGPAARSSNRGASKRLKKAPKKWRA